MSVVEIIILRCSHIHGMTPVVPSDNALQVNDVFVFSWTFYCRSIQRTFCTAVREFVSFKCTCQYKFLFIEVFVVCKPFGFCSCKVHVFMSGGGVN